MNHNKYDVKKAAGQISIAADPANYRYVVKTKRWDSNTGQETEPQAETVSLEELTARRAGHVEAIRQIDEMIKDLKKLPVLPVKPTVAPIV